MSSGDNPAEEAEKAREMKIQEAKHNGLSMEGAVTLRQTAD